MSITLTFNDMDGTYNERLIIVLFPLIAHILEDCPDSRVEPIRIPFSRGKFDELLEECVSYLRGDACGTWTYKSELYDFLLCDVGCARIIRQSMEQSFAKSGYLELLKLRLEMSCSSVGRTAVCFNAALNGHFDVLKWAHANGYPWNDWVSVAAVLNRNFAMLKWLFANGCPFSAATFAWAVMENNVEMIEWLYANNCSRDASACRWACNRGNYQLLKWLRAREFPLDQGACFCAAQGGHLEILKYLRMNGCPWLKQQCLEYAPSADVREWILAQPE